MILTRGDKGMARRAEERPLLDLNIEASSVRKSVTDMIVEQVREAILSQTLPGGTPLIEKQLAEEFRVSKTPVREALLRLAQTGLVDVAHVKGATVHQLDFAEMQDILEMRQVLEPLALKQSAPKLTGDDVKTLEQLLVSAAKPQVQQNLSKLGDVNNRFHNILYSRADNVLLLKWLNDLNDRRRLISAKGWKTDNRSSEELKEHRAILQAIKGKKFALAVKQLERHIQNFANLVLNHHPLAKEAA
jgi:DNA-binding GntR family transcriptional regulator